MRWNGVALPRLYQLHLQYVDTLRREVSKVNRTLGSANPENVKLQPLPFVEFQALLRDAPEDSEAVELWIRRIIRGHEHEFPELRAAG